MKLILALICAVQGAVAFAVPTADEEMMDKVTLFNECMRTIAEPNESIEEDAHTRVFCLDKVNHTHHTGQQIIDDTNKAIADNHRRCANPKQDDVSCKLWRFDPTSRAYRKCMALGVGEMDKNFLMNYCVVADREFQQCTQVWNKGKGASSEIEEYCLSGKINGREVNTQWRHGGAWTPAARDFIPLPVQPK